MFVWDERVFYWGEEGIRVTLAIGLNRGDDMENSSPTFLSAGRYVHMGCFVSLFRHALVC